MTRNFNNFTWIIPCDKFLLTITGMIFLWKKIMYFLLFADISFFHRTFCSATQIFFLWQKIPFRAGNLFLLVTTCMFATMCKNSNKYFMWGSKIQCHLGCQDAVKISPWFAQIGGPPLSAHIKLGIVGIVWIFEYYFKISSMTVT